MDFWNGIGDFFATFEPKDWVTAVIAVVAILVSMFTASQTWRYHPRPRLVVEYKAIRENIQTNDRGASYDPMAWINLANKGNEAAYDMQVKVTSPGLTEPVLQTLNILEPGEVKQLRWELIPFLSYTAKTPDDDFEEVPRPEFVSRSKVKARFTWRQSPSMWWKRRKTIRFKNSGPPE